MTMADEPAAPTHELGLGYEGPWIECWQCGGIGTVPGCFEDVCCGADCDPEDPEFCCAPSTCDICRGKGGWPDNNAAARARGGVGPGDLPDHKRGGCPVPYQQADPAPGLGRGGTGREQRHQVGGNTGRLAQQQDQQHKGRQAREPQHEKGAAEPRGRPTAARALQAAQAAAHQPCPPWPFQHIHLRQSDGSCRSLAYVVTGGHWMLVTIGECGNGSAVLGVYGWTGFQISPGGCVCGL